MCERSFQVGLWQMAVIYLRQSLQRDIGFQRWCILRGWIAFLIFCFDRHAAPHCLSFPHHPFMVRSSQSAWPPGPYRYIIACVRFRCLTKQGVIGAKWHFGVPHWWENVWIGLTASMNACPLHRWSEKYQWLVLGLRQQTSATENQCKTPVYLG